MGPSNSSYLSNIGDYGRKSKATVYYHRELGGEIAPTDLRANALVEELDSQQPTQPIYESSSARGG